MIEASALAGLWTAPPYAPECRSTGDSSTSICAYISPRSPTVIAGTLPSKKPVSLMTTASAARRSPCSAIHVSRLSRPVLLLALEQERHVDRRRAADRPERLDRVEVHHELALVVGDAAPDEPAVAHERLERRVLPQVERVDGLHVVVAVDDHRRRTGRLVDPAVDDRMQVGRDHLDLGRPDAAEAIGDPLGGRDHVGRVLVQGRHAGDARDLEQRLDPRIAGGRQGRLDGRVDRGVGGVARVGHVGSCGAVGCGGRMASIVARADGRAAADVAGKRRRTDLGGSVLRGASRAAVRPAAATGSVRVRSGRTTCRPRCRGR